MLTAVPERRKKAQNGQILEVEELHKFVISRVGKYSRNIRNIWSAEELVVVKGWLLAVHQRVVRTARVGLVMFTLKISHLNFQPCVWTTALCASLLVATDHPDHAAIDVQAGGCSSGRSMRLHCKVGGPWSWEDFTHFLMIEKS